MEMFDGFSLRLQEHRTCNDFRLKNIWQIATLDTEAEWLPAGSADQESNGVELKDDFLIIFRKELRPMSDGPRFVIDEQPL